VLVVGKSSTDRRSKKAIVNVFTMVIDNTHEPPLINASAKVAKVDGGRLDLLVIIQ